MKLPIGWAAAAALTLIIAGAWAENADDKIWVVIRPVQCLGNPWEKAWLKRNKNRAENYPRAQEVTFIKKYFTQYQIPVLDLRGKSYVPGEPTCQTCDCPRGDTLYLLTVASKTPQLVELGYTQRIPAVEGKVPASSAPLLEKK